MCDPIDISDHVDNFVYLSALRALPVEVYKRDLGRNIQRK